MIDLNDLGRKAKSAAASLYGTPDEIINKALLLSAAALTEHADEIKTANEKDIIRAKEKGLSAAFIDRLTVTDKVLDGMAEGLKQIATLSSPVGETVYQYENVEQGIKVVKKKVPFGVVGIIFESRPNVTADAFGLCLKNGPPANGRIRKVCIRIGASATLPRSRLRSPVK